MSGIASSVIANKEGANGLPHEHERVVVHHLEAVVSFSK
jgi:hypothetical protein